MSRRPNAYTQSLQEAQKRVEQEKDTTQEQDSGITAKPHNAITVEPHNGKMGEQHNRTTAKTEKDEEKATEKLTLYLHPSQRDKLDVLIMQYRQQTGKRITHNRLMRLLIEKVELKDLV